MADPKGFLKYGREVAERRPVEERVHDWNEVYPGGAGPGPAADHHRPRPARCMDCGIPFCHQGCPLGNLIPEWNDLVWRDDWDGAIERLHATNNFPEFTGRLCPAPCETACVLGINQDPVTIKNVEVAIIDRPGTSGYVRPQPPEWLSGRRSPWSAPARPASPPPSSSPGPATRSRSTSGPTRSAACCATASPSSRWRRQHLDRRLDQMRREGTVFRAGVDVGADAHRRQAARAVRRRGARHRVRPSPRDLPVPGPRARRHPPGDGVPPAVQPGLARRGGRRTRSPPTGKDVVIIGGGDTGADCLGTAIRQGAALGHPARDPARAARRPARRPALADVPDDLPGLLGARGGRRRVYAVSTQEFLGDDVGPRPGAAPGRGRVQGRAVRSRSRAPSARSRPSWCCSRWASPARSSPGWSSSSASTSTSAATSPATRRT